MVDTERIRKLLNLTTSTFNGEALNAIRKANEELKRNGQTWDEVLEVKGGSKSTRSFADDFANKMLIESLRKQSLELRKEREEYKRDYWNVKHECDDLKAFIVKDINERTSGGKQTQTRFSKEQPKGYTKSKVSDDSKKQISELYKQINCVPYGSKERSRLFDELDRLKAQRFK